MLVKAATPSPSLDVIGSARMGTPVIDTNTLRQAALQKSWLRDQRVARRRLAVRWVLWWLWKYRYYLLALCAILALLMYMFYPAGHTRHFGDAKPDTAPAPQTELRLRMQSQMLSPSDTVANPYIPIPSAKDSFQLKPETQLKTKETNP